MWSRFLGDRRGGVAPMFALGLVPVIGFVGAAVDYSRGNAARTAMQASLDATGLMLSRDAATMTPAEVTAKAVSYFTAQFNRPETANVQVTATLSSPQAGSFSLHVEATGNVPTTFTKLLGQDKIEHLLVGGREVGHQEARARARARQYRLDGQEQQADRAQDRRAQSAHHAAGGRQAAGRRQGRDHPVRYRRERRYRLQG